MKKPQPSTAFLGVVATSRAVHAALVEHGPEGPVVVETYLRQRLAPGAGGTGAGLPGGVPGAGGFGASPALDENSAPDFTIQFGGSGSGGSGAPGGAGLFLGTEFGAGEGEAEEGEDRTTVEAFAAELSEILDECAAAGYRAPTLVFAAASAHVSTHELSVAAATKGRKGDRAPKPREEEGAEPAPEKALSHEALVKLLKAQQGEADADRSAFLPMTPAADGTRRVLALVARPTDPVPATLDAIRRQPGAPSIGFLDAELSLYARLAALAAEGPDALVVRAGAEDTIVLFLRRGRVHHAETLRSLTAFDAPETICSRVLLQQDECGVEEVTDVYVLSEQREDDLLASFDTFFPGARVRSLREAVAGLATAQSPATLPSLAVAAAAAALRGARGERDGGASAVNLLPRRYLRRKIQLPFSAPVLALGALLVVTALFFSWRYVAMQAEIDAARNNLRQFPPTLAEEDARTLQARIDSLQGTYAAYNRALGVLDSLLVGSDRWSRTLEMTSREAAAVRGVWIDTWSPSSNLLTLDGTATTRERVVAFAERTGGDIERLAFHEIRDWPVYTFTVKLPLPNELPAAAEYLRAQALDRLAAADAEPDAAEPGDEPGDAEPGDARQASSQTDASAAAPVRTAALAND